MGKVQPLIEPMLAPEKTGGVEDRSGLTLEFIKEFTASMDDAFWLEEHDAIRRTSTLETAVDFSLLERALLSVNDIFLWCVELAYLYDCRLSVLLWPLSWATKFSGISASSSLEIHVLRTEWLGTRLSSLWSPAFWAAVDRNFQGDRPHVPDLILGASVLPYCQIKRGLRLIHFYRPVAFERLVELHWASFALSGIKFRLESLSMTFFLTMASLHPSFSKPNKHFFAIFILLELHIAPAKLSTLISRPESKVKWQKPPNCSLQRNWVGISEFPCREDDIFFLVFECSGSMGLVTFAVFMNKRLAFCNENFFDFSKSLSLRTFTEKPFPLRYLWILRWKPEMVTKKCTCPARHTFLCKFWHFQMAVSCLLLGLFTPNLGILCISVYFFWLCG